MDTKALFKISYGLFVLTAKNGDKDNGCIINTAMQVTSQPNRISIAVNKANYTNSMIASSGEFSVSVISEAASFDLFKRFGFASGKDSDKFAGFNGAKRGGNGIYYITEGCNAYICAKVVQTVDLGSHTLFIADITDMEVLSDVPSATYTFYHEHIKPKPAQTASEGGKTAWRCKICGFVWVGEELPPDFICPTCKHPASDFEKITV